MVRWDWPTAFRLNARFRWSLWECEWRGLYGLQYGGRLVLKCRIALRPSGSAINARCARALGFEDDFYGSLFCHLPLEHEVLVSARPTPKGWRFESGVSERFVEVVARFEHLLGEEYHERCEDVVEFGCRRALVQRWSQQSGHAESEILDRLGRILADARMDLVVTGEEFVSEPLLMSWLGYYEDQMEVPEWM